MPARILPRIYRLTKKVGRRFVKKQGGSLIASTRAHQATGLAPHGLYDVTGALRRERRPPVLMQRGDYRETWDVAASHVESAFAMVDGSPDEEALRASGGRVAQWLKTGLAIEPSHRVLVEVGCGVARIGRELAPLCSEWHGVDISPNMIRIAAQRTSHLANVHLRALAESSKLPFPDATFERVYSHIVLFHMDKEDMFAYIAEFARVLKPGGLAYFDTWNLAHPFGWQRFLHEAELHGNTTPRPVNRAQFATPEEVMTYTSKAGLGIVALLTGSSLAQVIAVRPHQGEPVEEASTRLRRQLGSAIRTVEPRSARLNVLPTPEQAILTVDVPTEEEYLSGTIEFSGWALHPWEVDDPAWGEVAVFCVAILLQRGEEVPVELGYASHNLPRPDVASAFEVSRFRDVGWRFSWDSRQVANGEYRLWVEAHLTCGYKQKSVLVRVDN